MTPELQERAGAYGVDLDLARYDARLALVDAWLERGHRNLDAEQCKRLAVLRTLADAPMHYDESFQLAGGSAAYIAVEANGKRSTVRLWLSDRTVPPPDPRCAVAMMLNTPELLAEAFDSFDRVAEWLDEKFGGR